MAAAVTQARTAARDEAQAAADAVFAAAQAAIASPEGDPEVVAAAARGAVAAAAVPGLAARTAATAVADATSAAARIEGAAPQQVVDAATGAVAPAVTAGGNAVAPVARARITIGGLTLEAASEGSWGNRLSAKVDHTVRADPDAAVLFNLSITDLATGALEVFRNVSVAPDHVRRIDRVLADGSELVRAIEPLPPGRPAILESGVTVQASDGQPLTAAHLRGTEADKTGMYALADTDVFNLLCLPPPAPDVDVDFTTWDEAAAYCADRRAMLLVDPPANWTRVTSARDADLSTVAPISSNAALFFPRLRQPNPKRGNQIETFAPCGAVAGIFARTDARRGVWKAPAGMEAILRGTPALSVPMTDNENGELNPRGINCLRILRPAGRVVWGARTLDGDDRLASEWKYIPVRRTALFIEESLFRGLQWVVFEPNDEPLWAQIRLNVGTFLNGMFRQGAFQGKSSSDAYFVRCDSETTTQADIDRGIVNIVVGFAPLKPAEFVIIKLQQIAGETQV